VNRSAILVAIGFLWVGTAAAQSPSDMKPQQQTSAQNQQASSALPAGAPIGAALSKSIDSKKLKPGDPVVAEASESTDRNGTPIIPRGTKIEGHVTQAAAREKGAAFSSIGVVFDKAVLKDGQQIPLNVSVQAIALSQNAATAPNTNSGAGMTPMNSPGSSSPSGSSTGRMGGGAPMGQPAPSTPATTPTDTVGNVNTNNAQGGTGSVGGLNSSGVLTANSRGVFGLPGIGLSMSREGAQPAAVITSTDKHVHLDSGTQLLLVTQETPAPKS
jgi:hypothetical protein